MNPVSLLPHLVSNIGNLKVNGIMMVPRKLAVCF